MFLTVTLRLYIGVSFLVVRSTKLLPVDIKSFNIFRTCHKDKIGRRCLAILNIILGDRQRCVVSITLTPL